MDRQQLQQALSRVTAQEAAIQSTWVHRLLCKVGPTRPFVAVYRRLGPMIDPWLLRTTGGRIATHVYGFPALLLVTTGAKSGQPRTSPLFYTRDGDCFFVVGTNFGTEHHPGWTANLLKSPACTITVGTDTLDAIADLVDEETFRTMWPRFTSIYPGYDDYLKRLHHRAPRMFRLRPVVR